MKILIYTEYFFPIPGGVQTVVFELARGLAEWQQKHPGTGSFQVTVLTRTEESAPEDASYPFDLVRRPGFWKLVQHIRHTDLVHLAGPAMLPLVIALLLGKPVVVEHHGFHTACPNGLLFLEATQAPCPGHFMAKRYSKCLACNRSTVGAFKSASWLALTPVRRWLSNRASVNIMPTNWLGSVLELNRMTTIYHGVSKAVGSDARRPSGATFTFQGRLVTTKGASLLIEAARLLRTHNRDVKLRFIGDGPELPVLEASSIDFDGQIEFLGHVSSLNLDEALSDATAVVMPSLGGEVFGLVAAENMMRGKLLIVSDVGALREVVGDTGLVFATEDASALAECMRQVLEDSELARSLGAAARERAMRIFDLDSMIQAHVSVYQAL